MNLPEKDLLKWLSENFGVGGFENYSNKQVETFLRCLTEILKTFDKTEYAFLGNLLIELSEKPILKEYLLTELIEWGYSGD